MPIDHFIIAVFCLIDDELKRMLGTQKVRKSGPRPALEDSEVMTMEIVGEFLGIDTDKGIWEYFKGHWSCFFPDIPDRSNFAKQAANLHVIKRLLQEHLTKVLGAYGDNLHLIDGLPIPVCKLARAHFSKIFKGDVAYGYCATKKEHYYGFRGHIVSSSIGIITGATFTAANIDERDVCPELVGNIKGLLLGDKGYIRPALKEDLRAQEIYLETLLKDNMEENRPTAYLKWLMSTRRLIETVIGQLTERFHIEKVRARNKWHQAGRFWRKILAHTTCIALNLAIGNEPLQFEQLIAY